MKLTKEHREQLIKQLTNLTDQVSVCMTLIRQTANDKNIAGGNKEKLISLWDLDIHLAEKQIEEIKTIIINNKF